LPVSRSRKLVLQRHQGRALLGDQQQARGLLVEPVHEFEELRRRARLAQLLDDAEADAAAAMHGHAGGLVDGDQVLVLVHHREFARRRGRFGRPVGHAHRRHTHHVADLQTSVGGGAALVDAHFARADDAVDMRLGHALEQPDEEVVQPLALRALVDREAQHARGVGSRCGRLRFGPYNRRVHVVL
jgi:hypothetical protein